MLEVNKIDTYYGDIQILKQVSLNVGDGELVAVFGANGHGKSTLLQTICGLIAPRSGSIKFDNTKINGFPMYNIVGMGVVYVAEERNLFPEMTVLENLKLGAFCMRARRIMPTTLETVYKLFPKLSDMRNRIASTLSGGEARMLAIGRGLMSSAKFLAIDEPSLGLAPNIRHLVFDIINKIRKSGIGILLVEQNVTEALEIVDRIFLMEDGKLVFESSKEDALSAEKVRKLFLGM